MEPRFLSLTEVLEIHQDQIVRYGGHAGLRDLELLKSALAMPAATFGGAYLHGDIFQMAAAYLFHLVSNHPFVDGNKRVGTASALVFLALNGYRLSASDEKLAELVLSVAHGECDKAEISLTLKRWVIPVRSESDNIGS